ncbi:MAG: polysaccharide biosynthesis C-terminal domain-containing protein [Thermoanaerobaculia bacterium]
MIRRLAWVFLHQGVGRGSVFAFFALLPLVLPLDAVGRFTLAWAVLLFALQPALEAAAGTLLVRAGARGDATTSRRVARAAVLTCATLAALLVLLAFGVRALAPVWGWLGAAFALLLPLNLLFASARGRGLFALEGIAGTAQKVALPILLLVLAPDGADESFPAKVLLLSAIPGWAAAALVLAARPLPPAPVPQASAPAPAAPWREIFLLAALSATAFLALRADLGLLRAYRGFRDVGLFATASRWVEAAYVLPYGAMLAFFPTVAAERPTNARLRKAASLFAAVGILGAIAVAAGALLLAPRLYDGSGAEIAAIVARLAPAALPVAISTLCGQALVARERTGLALAGALAGLAVHLSGSLLLVPSLGPGGAAYAAVTGELIGAVTAALLLSRALGNEA